MTNIEKSENDKLQVNVELYKENKKSGRKVIYKEKSVSQNNQKYVFSGAVPFLYLSNVNVSVIDTSIEIENSDIITSEESESLSSLSNQSVLPNVVKSDNYKVTHEKINKPQINIKIAELMLGYKGFIIPNLSDKIIHVRIDNTQLVKMDKTIKFIQLPTTKTQSFVQYCSFQLDVPTIIALKDGVKMKVTINKI